MPLLARAPLMMMTFITQGGEGRSAVPEKLTFARHGRGRGESVVSCPT